MREQRKQKRHNSKKGQKKKGVRGVGTGSLGERGCPGINGTLQCFPRRRDHRAYLLFTADGQNTSNHDMGQWHEARAIRKHGSIRAVGCWRCWWTFFHGPLSQARWHALDACGIVASSIDYGAGDRVACSYVHMCVYAYEYAYEYCTAARRQRQWSWPANPLMESCDGIILDGPSLGD